MGVICVLPFIVRPYQLDFLIFLFINIILVVSFRLIAITGEFSLAHAVLMGCGAYASTMLNKYTGLSPWVTLPFGACVAGMVAYLLSFPLFRMKMFYFLIASFAAGEAIRLCWTRFRDPFGGFRGLRRIPSLEIDIPGVVYLDLGFPVPFYFFALIVGLVCLVIMYRLEHSRFGLNFHATHWQDQLCASVGVNCRHFRMTAFTIAGVFAGLAGGLLAHYLGSINPNLFGLTLMLYVLVWSIAGGLGSFAGPIIGVTLLSIIDESVRSSAQEFRPAIYGAVLIATMLFLPQGIESLPDKLKPHFLRLIGREPTANKSTDGGS
ncbi:MAG: branched-chain amino acid ABC transporter permease [Alphaproteobacteria bacterium]